MDRANTDLRQWAEDARGELLTLPDVPVRAAFEGLCDYVVSRTG
jgi:heptaprenyl diphosphate synthase